MKTVSLPLSWVLLQCMFWRTRKWFAHSATSKRKAAVQSSPADGKRNGAAMSSSDEKLWSLERKSFQNLGGALSSLRINWSKPVFRGFSSAGHSARRWWFEGGETGRISSDLIRLDWCHVVNVVTPLAGAACKREYVCGRFHFLCPVTSWISLTAVFLLPVWSQGSPLKLLDVNPGSLSDFLEAGPTGNWDERAVATIPWHGRCDDKICLASRYSYSSFLSHQVCRPSNLIETEAILWLTVTLHFVTVFTCFCEFWAS